MALLVSSLIAFPVSTGTNQDLACVTTQEEYQNFKNFKIFEMIPSFQIQCILHSTSDKNIHPENLKRFLCFLYNFHADLKNDWQIRPNKL